MNKKNLQRLKDTQGFMFDMDGTLVLGDAKNEGIKPIPGAIEMIQHLNEKGIPYVLLTNGTARTEAEYQKKLRDVGFPLNDKVCMTPSTVAADYFTRKKHKRILVLGCKGVWQPLKTAGLDIVLPDDDDQENIDAVYVGWYREFKLADMDPSYAALMNGAKLYTASMVPFFATASGKAFGSSYLIAGMLAKVTGKRATVMGKPSLQAMNLVARRLGVAKERIAVVGDDPGLEVPMAHKVGALAVAVFSGYHGEGDFGALGEEVRPHLSLLDVKALLASYLGGAGVSAAAG